MMVLTERMNWSQCASARSWTQMAAAVINWTLPWRRSSESVLSGVEGYDAVIFEAECEQFSIHLALRSLICDCLPGENAPVPGFKNQLLCFSAVSTCVRQFRNTICVFCVESSRPKKLPPSGGSMPTTCENSCRSAVTWAPIVPPT